jgi:hypothetical protein
MGGAQLAAPRADGGNRLGGRRGFASQGGVGEPALQGEALDRDQQGIGPPVHLGGALHHAIGAPLRIGVEKGKADQQHAERATERRQQDPDRNVLAHRTSPRCVGGAWRKAINSGCQ